MLAAESCEERQLSQEVTLGALFWHKMVSLRKWFPSNSCSFVGAKMRRRIGPEASQIPGNRDHMIKLRVTCSLALL